ncbi:MAG: DUF4123 domain-containing protein [Cellvibrionaceae bacterium]|nr:DUF4123 domain-containing protein [Cellvibrionaceae bacterium]
MQSSTVETITHYLWPNGSTNRQKHRVYTLLDGARSPQIAPMIASSELHNSCLYSGSLTDKLRMAAPYIVELNSPQSYFTQQLITQGWGQSWCIFLLADPYSGLDSVRRHCKTLSFAEIPSGEKVLFRYYDPNILQTYLPTCTSKELDKVFGPVTQIIMEDRLDHRYLHRFQHNEAASNAMRYRICN